MFFLEKIRNLKTFNKMIQEVKMYTVICDNCKKDSNDDTDYSCWNDKNAAREVAMNDNWIVEDDKDYCPDCYSYDDEDNLTIGKLKTFFRIEYSQKQELFHIEEHPVGYQKVPFPDWKILSDNLTSDQCILFSEQIYNLPDTPYNKLLDTVQTKFRKFVTTL